MRLWLLIFLGTITLVRRAQRNYFTKLEGNPSSLLGIFPHAEHGITTLRDSVEEGNIQRVVAILQSNIKQWSFIEAQLLEPNVNLGMPEIFIPLKHLTTTLEILGNIFFMKNELVEAKDCLERACPLMELLPASLLENAGVGNPVVDFGLKGEGLSDEHFQTSHPGAEDGKMGNNYASDCFALLRNVYMKLYGNKKATEGGSEGDAEMVAATAAAPTPGNVDEHPQPDQELSFDQDYDFEYDDPYDDSDETNTGPFNMESKIEELRMPFQHLRSELIMIHGKSFDSDNIDYEYYEFSLEENHGRAGEIHPPPSNNHQPQQQKSRKSAFNANSNNNNNNFNSKGSLSESKQNNNPAPSSSSRLNGVPGFRGNFFMGGNNGLDSYTDESADYKDPLLMGLGGSATSIIASDLEVMLRKFVNEDLDGQLDLFNVARKYYDELDVNFPQMDEHEYAANMDIGRIFLEIMGRVVDEGFGFIAPELERWQDIEQIVLFRTSDNNQHQESGNINSNNNKQQRKEDVVVGMVDSSYFDDFSLAERNRLLVLSAFDIALNLEPYEHFDLSLGFSLGILDNDHSRQKYPQEMHLEDFLQHGSNKRTRKEKGRGGGHALSGKPDEVPAAMFEDQSISTIHLAASSMRSSVPTLKAENDWTFHFFLLFMIATALVVYVAYQESVKKREKSRPRGRTQKKPLLQDGVLPFLLHYFSNTEEPIENVTVGLVVVKVSSFVAEAVVNYFRDVGKTIYLGIAGEEQPPLVTPSQKAGPNKNSKVQQQSKDKLTTAASGKVANHHSTTGGASSEAPPRNETMLAKLLGFLKTTLGSRREINLTKVSNAPSVPATKLEVFSVVEERAKTAKANKEVAVAAGVDKGDASNNAEIGATTSESDHEQTESSFESTSATEENNSKELEEKSKIDDLPNHHHHSVSSASSSPNKPSSSSDNKRSASPNPTSLKQLASNSAELSGDSVSGWQEATNKQRRVQFKSTLTTTSITEKSDTMCSVSSNKEVKKIDQRKANSPSSELVGVLKHSPAKQPLQPPVKAVTTQEKKPHHTVSLEEFTQKKSNTTTITDNATLIKNERGSSSPTKLSKGSEQSTIAIDSTGSNKAASFGASKQPPSYKQAVVTSASNNKASPVPSTSDAFSVQQDEFGAMDQAVVSEVFGSSSPSKVKTVSSGEMMMPASASSQHNQLHSFASLLSMGQEDATPQPYVLHTREAAMRANNAAEHTVPSVDLLQKQVSVSSNSTGFVSAPRAPPPGLQLLGAAGLNNSTQNNNSGLSELSRGGAQVSFAQSTHSSSLFHQSNQSSSFADHNFSSATLASSPQHQTGVPLLANFGNDSLFGASYSTPNPMSLLPSSLFTSPLASTYKHELDDDADFLNGVLDDILHPSSPTPSVELFKHSRQHQPDDFLFSTHHTNNNRSSFDGINQQLGSSNSVMMASTPPTTSLLQANNDGLISDLSPHAPVFLPSNLSMAAPRMDNSSVLSDPMQYLTDNPAFFFNPDDLWDGGNNSNKYGDASSAATDDAL